MAVWPGVYAARDEVPGRTCCWTCDNGFEPPRRRQQDVIDDAGSVIRIVQGDGHSIHGNDFKRLPFKLQVKVTIRGSIHETPELVLARSDLNLRSHKPVQREDLFWRFWLRTTNIRTEFNAMPQISRLLIVHNGTAAHNQHSLW